MRYDVPVFFQQIRQGEYDSKTGNYKADTVDEVKYYANITDAGTETMNLIYGELRQGSKVIRLQNNCTEPFERIRIDRKLYRVDFSRKLRTKHVFVVSEVQ